MADEAKRPLKVFLCHASGDKPVVRELYKRLIAEGVDAWLDQEKLLPGQDWRVEIPRAVREADVVVICLSNKSITKEGYVQKEIRFSLDSAEEKPEGTIFLIPARLEDCIVPDRLDRWQWVDLFDENGFLKLLRSLKLRADKVGARIEPTSDFDSDEERQHRLEQLYTEGLAAFYTEDWDRAFRRFQAILSEQPNHRNAAEKLAEAELQRDLAKLYAQATEALRSEDWQVAIKTLEELSRKSASYKDVAQLLGNARKQKQLQELYAEAKTLHAAQKWQAVIRVFEQISVIEPNYPDPDGLLTSAQKEVVELQRVNELNDLYSRGIRKMDEGQWYEARSLLEQVHKAQIGFLETERLLRKVEDEIGKIEALNQRNIHVNTLYEQAHELVRSKNWRKAQDKLEEIHKLDDHFVDTDGIFEKVRTELTREEQEAQQQRELGVLYAEAVNLLQAKKYQEALEKWNAIQTINPKYKDTARVKTIAKKKLDELSSTDTVDQSWLKSIANWVRVETNISVDREILTERLLLLSFASIVIIDLIFVVVSDWMHIRAANIIVRFLFLLFIGGLYGIVVGFALSKTISNWHRKQSWTVIIGWGLAQSVPLIARQYFTIDFATIYALFAGLSTTIAIRWARPLTRFTSLVAIFASWVIVWKAALLLEIYLQTVFNSQSIADLADPLSVVLGLLFTFGFQIEETWEILKTALFGALGFAIGNAVADIISTPLQLPAEISFAVWGIIGGAILEAPSHNLRQIVFSAIMCGIGLFAGAYVAFDILPAVGFQYVNSAFLDKNIILHQPFLGLGLGLALGLLIRRASAIGVLTLIGAGMFMITRALNVEIFDFSSLWESAIRGVFIGLVLGYGYGYTRRAKVLEIKPSTPKLKWVWVAIIGLLAIAILVVVWLFSPPRLTAYRWDFDHSIEGWGDYHDLNIPHVGNGFLTFQSTGIDPSFESPIPLAISASKTPVITVRMHLIQGQGTVGQIFFITNQDSNWDETKSVVFTLGPGGIFRTYNILMSENPAWRGTITKIRLDPVNDPSTASTQFAIDYISVHAP